MSLDTSAGTKTNERPGVRAQVKYVRSSAYKAREVLNLIRGERVGAALEILEFTERDIARIILKGLESAIANAGQPAHGVLDPDELYVSACYADEGPTLKRFRPRARGRASRIRKRTCHITIIVSRLPEDRLAVLRAAETTSGAAKGSTKAAAEARRERVSRSRQTKAEKKAAAEAAEHDHDHDHEGHDHDHDHDHEGHDHDEPSAADVAEAEDEAGIVDQQAVAIAEAEAGDDTNTDADDVDAEEKDS
jgi:large subunit ribosomal protein L22